MKTFAALIIALALACPASAQDGVALHAVTPCQDFPDAPTCILSEDFPDVEPTDSAREGLLPSGFLLGLSYSYRLGGKLTFGYELFRILGFYVSPTFLGYWAQKVDATLGLGVVLSLPLPDSRFSPLIEIAIGSDLESAIDVFNSCDDATSYTSYTAGTRYFFDRNIFLLGALSYTETDEYISGGCTSGWSHSVSTPRLSRKKSFLGFTLGVGITCM